MYDSFLTSAFAGLHGVIFVGGVRVRWSGHVGHMGRDRGLSEGRSAPQCSRRPLRPAPA